MPQETDLMGLGMDAFTARLLGNQSQKVTCVGTAQAGAAVIKTNMAELTTAGGATAAVISNASNDPADIGTPYFVANSSATTALVYAPVGHTLNGTLNATLSLAQNKAAFLIQTSVKNWYSLTTA